MAAMEGADKMRSLARSRSSASTASLRVDSSDDGRPKSSRSGKHRSARTTISLSDIEAARISAAAALHQQKVLDREGGGGGERDRDLEEIEQVHRRHRRTSSGSSTSGKRKKRLSRSGTVINKDDVEQAQAGIVEEDSSRRSRGSRNSAEELASADGYATLRKSRKSRPRDAEDEVGYRRHSSRSVTSEDEFLRLEAERAQSRASERSHEEKLRGGRHAVDYEYANGHVDKCMFRLTFIGYIRSM